MISGKQLNGIGLPYVRYNDLDKIESLDELINIDQPGISILIETKPHVGHWILLLKRSPTLVEFFDSYGLGIDAQLDYAPYSAGHEYVSNLLTNWADNSPKSGPKKRIVEYLNSSIQSRDPRVVTCGRHVGWRYINRSMSLRKYLDSFEFHEKPNEVSKEGWIDNDTLVEYYTKSIFGAS
jgi:hypothetical protein